MPGENGTQTKTKKFKRKGVKKMKKFTKLFLSCAAIAALTASIGISAMAADGDANITGGVTGTFNAETKTITITALDGDTPVENQPITFLVFKGKTDADITQANIVGIDQDTSDGTVKAPTNNGLKSDMTIPGEGDDAVTYTVKVGYYNANGFATKTGTFTLGQSVLVGDTNLDTEIDLSDATVIVNHAMDIRTITDATALIAADVNYDEEVDLSDATCIVNYAMDMPTGKGHAGETK